MVAFSVVSAPPVASRQARHSFTPNQVRHPTDCRFTSGCSPPRLAATQLPSITEPTTGSGTDFHRADKAPSRGALIPPDGVPISGGDPPTLLIAPPLADFREVYAAGQAIASLPLSEQYPRARAAIAQGGTYDFQRNVPEQKLYHAYIPAANYAVGVYMAGAGYSLFDTLALAKIYASGHSSNYSTQDREGWIRRGWNDANSGLWR